MSKLNDEFEKAQDSNLIKDTSKVVAKKATKKVKGKITEKGIKKLGGKLGAKYLKARGQLGGLLKAPGKLLQAGGKAVFQFLITPPWGWVVSGVLIVLVVAPVLNSMDGEFSDAFGTQEMTDDEIVAILDAGCETIGTTDGNTNGSGGVESGGAGDSDWTYDGSTANLTAKTVFDHWVDSGLSGSAAAGIVGWVNSEGGFGMIGRAEGHYGNDIRTNSVKYGVIPLKMSWYTHEGGGGIYQFTPYTKYAPLGSDDWEDAEKMNAFVGNQIMNGDWNSSMDLTGGDHSFRDMAKSTDPQYATLMWQAYERGSVDHINQDQKKRDAQKANDMFNGDNHQYNESVFNATFGTGGNEGGGSSNPIDTGDINPCAQVRNGGGDGWQGAGGTVSMNSGVWLPQDLPDELKGYAIDPTTVGLTYGANGGWDVVASSQWNQCTDLTANLMHHLWHKDGVKPSQGLGDGGVVASNWASIYGGSTTNNPTSGGVFSQVSEDLSGSWGHTGVVSHVFENGDMLVVEQNWGRFSGGGELPPGDPAGPGPYTWSYRMIAKSQFGDYTFYNPADVGFEVNKDAKSL